MISSLIYRELYISRKFYITGILVTLLLIVMCCLVRSSMLYGNLAHLDPEIFDMVNTITYYAFTYVIAYAAFSLVDDTGVILSDFRSNWRVFSYALPVTAEKNVLVKYIIKMGAFCIAMLLSIINGAIIGAFSGRNFGIDQIMNFFLLANFWLLVDLLRVPFMLRSRTEKGFHMSGFGFMMLMAAIMFPLMRKITAIGAEIAVETEANDLTPDQQMFLLQQRIMEFVTDIHDKILVWMPLLTVVILALGFVICVQCLKRREN